jgi:pilus assembly protein Flp/PilA
MNLASLMQRTRAFVRLRFVRSEAGASLVEYALLLALVAIACLVALQFVGGSVSNSLNSSGSSIWP